MTPAPTKMPMPVSSPICDAGSVLKPSAANTDAEVTALRR